MSDCSIEDVQALLANGVAESRTLEYKSVLPGNSDGDKKEFLADVSALANTEGGVLVFGVATGKDERNQETGVPQDIVGIPRSNIEQERLRLISLLTDGAAPPLVGQVQLVAIEVPKTDRSVLLIGVRSSLLRPHMVSFQKSNRFFRRSDAGKYPVMVEELRRMFLEPSDWLRRAGEYRDARVAQVQKEQFWRRLAGGPAFFLHILPLGRLEQFLDLKQVSNEIVRVMPPLDHRGWDYSFNAEGIVTFRAEEEVVQTYAQVLRNGAVELYATSLTRVISRNGTDTRLLYAPELMKRTVSGCENALRVATELLGQDHPFALALTLINAQGLYIPDEMGRFIGPMTCLEIRLPPVLIESGSASVATIVSPLFDVIWQAAGASGVPQPPQVV